MNVFRQSYQSITDFEFYRTVVRQPLWKSILYFVFWVTLAATFMAAVYSVRFVYPKLQEVGDWLIQNLPPMEIKQGKLYTKAPTPFTLERKNPDVRIVIDPSDRVRKAERKEGMDVIFNSDRIYYQFQGQSNAPIFQDAYLFRKQDNFQIDRQSLESARRLLKVLLLPLSLVIVSWLYNWLTMGFTVFFLVACGLLLWRSGRPQLAWRHWFNIAIYALTPAVLVDMIFKPTTVPAPIPLVFYVFTAMIYTLMAAQRCGRPDTGDFE
ncbi:MAG TPA: DUF1189 family protein [Acidobacteriota bacterium]|jgi:hypothetical protein